MIWKNNRPHPAVGYDMGMQEIQELEQKIEALVAKLDIGNLET